jgi:hypothetical protein
MIMNMESQEPAIPPESLPLLRTVGSGSRRRFGRLPQEALQCNLGAVLDISAGGMRVLTRSKPSGKIEIVLKGYPMPGRLVASVSWVKRAGLFMREVGLCFENLSPEMSQALTSIASVHRYRRVI